MPRVQVVAPKSRVELKLASCGAEFLDGGHAHLRLVRQTQEKKLQAERQANMDQSKREVKALREKVEENVKREELRLKEEFDMKKRQAKRGQLMLDEDLQAKASMAGETLSKAGQSNKAAAHAGTEFLKMRKDLKALKSTLRAKSANSVEKNDSGSNKGKNSIGKSITLERLDYTALGKKRRRRRRQLRAKSLPKLNRKLSPFRETH